MNWNHIQYFIAVAHHGSLSAASKQMGVNHATVARHIERLENELDTRLFDRLPNGYRLTIAGEVFSSQTKDIENNIARMIRNTSNHDRKLSGQITVGKPSSGILNLAPAFEAFQQQFRNIELKIISTAALSNIDQLDVDVAIRLSKIIEPNLVTQELGILPFYIYGSTYYLKKHLKCKPEQILSSSEINGIRLEELQWVIWEDPESSIDMSTILKKQIPNMNTVLTSNCYNDVYEAVVSGMGVSFFPPTRIKRHDDLLAVNPQRIHFEHKLSLLSHPDLSSNLRVTAFIHSMGGYFKNILTQSRLHN